MATANQSNVLDEFGRPIQRVPAALGNPRRWPDRLTAGFDAAELADTDNERHWANADSLSPNAAATYEIRKRLRNRARYECKNNTYCRGMVSTLANDTIGRGPRLQMQSSDSERNADIERAWSRWARAVNLAHKLRTIRQSKAVDGEGLAITTSNPRLPDVTLDLQLLESDYLTSPWKYYTTDEREHVDGVELDGSGNPVAYYLLHQHPGATLGTFAIGNEGTWYPSGRVFHLIYSDRAGQQRGIPEITPALPLYAILRRYTLATLGAAETAADIAGVLKSSAPPDTSPQSVDPFLAIEFERRALLTMPLGWDMQQLRAEQPTTTYPGFKREIINEIARCLHMPFNVAAGNSSEYNYASGRLDHQLYMRAIEIERHEIEVVILDRLFRQWLAEYTALSGSGRPSQIEWSQYPMRWVWDGWRHADPSKEANAAITLWQAGLLSDDQYLLREGIDPEEHYRQLEAEMERRERLGLPRPGVAMQEINVNDGDVGDVSPPEPAANGGE